MKKKLLSLALVLVMALTLLPTAAFAEEDLPEPPGTEASDPSDSTPDDSTALPPETKEADPDANPDASGGPDAANPDASGGSSTTPAAGTCTKTDGCTNPPHDPACPEACTAATTEGSCTATGTHKPGCIENCTKQVDCLAATHKAGCASQTPAPAPVACTKTEGCTAASHDQDCPKLCTNNDQCTNTAGVSAEIGRAHV